MSKKKRRLVEDTMQVEDLSLDVVILAIAALGAVDPESAVIENDWYDYDAARPIVRFKRPETKAERKARKNPKSQQALVFKASDPIASLGATAPPAPGFIVGPEMPHNVPDGTIWISTSGAGGGGGSKSPVDEMPPETRPRWAWWAGLTALVFAILYLALLVFGLVTHR